MAPRAAYVKSEARPAGPERVKIALRRVIFSPKSDSCLLPRQLVFSTNVKGKPDRKAGAQSHRSKDDSLRQRDRRNSS